MGKIEVIFEEQWYKLIETYKKDWKTNLLKRGSVALAHLPEHFYSEGDMEGIFSCMLRKRFNTERYYGHKIVVRNQFSLVEGGYEGLTVSDKIVKMRKLIKESDIGKESFVPDIVIDTLSYGDVDHFLLFSELTYNPGSNTRYNKGSHDYLDNLMEKVEEEAKTLTAAIRKKVCSFGYICVISDDLVSIDGAIYLVKKKLRNYPKVHLLLDGMSLEEKNEILN